LTQKAIPFLSEKTYCPFYAVAPDSGLVVASVLTTAQELGLRVAARLIVGQAVVLNDGSQGGIILPPWSGLARLLASSTVGERPLLCIPRYLCAAAFSLPLVRLVIRAVLPVVGIGSVTPRQSNLLFRVKSPHAKPSS